jgi:glycosyltransferase involved in cell wall biosynthesis
MRKPSAPEKNIGKAPVRVTAVGPLPPPPGGVASCLQSLVDATRDLTGVTVEVIKWKSVWKLCWRRPDVVHFFFTRPWKRLLGSLLGRLIGSKVLHTVPSNDFDIRNAANRLAAQISHGFIVLNADTYDRVQSANVKNSVIMTPIFALDKPTSRAVLDPQLDNWLASRETKVAVVYSHDKREIDGYDIYGFQFVASQLLELHKMGWSVVFLDPYAFYAREELFPPDCPNAFLQSYHVDFGALLQQVDAYLRPTATDGSSVAVLEALSLGLPVIASDIVPRPTGVNLYDFRNKDSFLATLEDGFKSQKQVSLSLTKADEYLNFIKLL